MTTDLRQLLDNVAESTVPSDLAHNAVAAAGQRRRNRFVVAGSMVATAAVVLAFVVVVQPFAGTTAEVQPAGVAELPAQLPAAEGLPTLQEAPMDAASAAYVIGGEVVLINAETGEAVKLFPTTDDLAHSLSGTQVLAADPSLGSGWNRVVLSPDGRYAVLTAPSQPTAEGALGDHLYVLDIAAFEIERVRDVWVANDEAGEGLQRQQVLAWLPDAEHFACACAFEGEVPNLKLIPSVPPWYPETQGTGIVAIDVAPYQVAAGAAGVVVQLEPQGKWFETDFNTLELGRPFESAALLAPSAEEASDFAAVDNFFDAGAAGINGWTIEIETGIPATLPSRPSMREGTAVAVGWTPDGYIVSVRPANAQSGEPPPPVALDVVIVDEAGNEHTLTQTTVGSSAPSFASVMSFTP